MSAASPTIIKSVEIESKMPEICDRLGSGQCVAIPTETVYGLAADATHGIGVASIFEMKGRPSFNPLICHVDGIDMAEHYADIGDTARKLADAFWPGPLTLILPLKDGSKIHPLVTAGLDTIGIRCPKGIACRVIEVYGKPLAAPSANRSGRISPTRAEHVQAEFAGTQLLILDDGPCDIGIESTIVRASADILEVLRPGSITASMLEETLGIRVKIALPGSKIEAPGMMKSHYAPNTPIQINQTICPEGAALLAFGKQDGKDRSGARVIVNLSPSGDLKEAASNLYACMKELDAAGAETISTEPIPATGLGVAINDRLQRAAAPKES